MAQLAIVASAAAGYMTYWTDTHSVGDSGIKLTDLQAAIAATERWQIGEDSGFTGSAVQYLYPYIYPGGVPVELGIAAVETLYIGQTDGAGTIQFITGTDGDGLYTYGLTIQHSGISNTLTYTSCVLLQDVDMSAISGCCNRWAYDDSGVLDFAVVEVRILDSDSSSAFNAYWTDTASTGRTTSAVLADASRAAYFYNDVSGTQAVSCCDGAKSLYVSYSTRNVTLCDGTYAVNTTGRCKLGNIDTLSVKDGTSTARFTVAGSSGLCTRYNDTATQGLGQPYIIYNLNYAGSTAQTPGSLGTGTYNSTFRVSYYLQSTSTAGAGNVYVQVTYTDDNGSVNTVNSALLPLNAQGFIQGSFICRNKNTSQLTPSVLFDSTGGAYRVDLTIERIS